MMCLTSAFLSFTSKVLPIKLNFQWESSRTLRILVYNFETKHPFSEIHALETDPMQTFMYESKLDDSYTK